MRVRSNAADGLPVRANRSTAGWRNDGKQKKGENKHEHSD